MVGGMVIGFARTNEYTTVNVEAQNRKDTLAVRVIERRVDTDQPVVIHVGDTLWWQGGWAMWTPVPELPGGCGVGYDIQLKRNGYSH